MHTQREKVWVSPLLRGDAIRRWLSHLYRSVLPNLYFPLTNYLVSDLPWDPAWVRRHPSGKKDLASGRSKTRYGLVLSLHEF